MRRKLALSTALAAVALAAALQIAPASAASYDPLVYRAQMALNAKGFQTGSPDGVLGPRTQAALAAYQRANGLPTNGAVTADLVAQLEGSAWLPRAPRPPLGADRERERLPQSELIRQTQVQLNRLGYNLTFEGGRLNGETSDAIRDYQARHGYEPTGMPGDRLLAEMRRDTVRVDPSSTWRTMPVPSAGIASVEPAGIGSMSSTTTTTTRSTTTMDNSMTQQELIVQTQAELRRHGYSIPSGVGVLDTDTENAILAYQSANGLPQNGLASAQLLYALRTDNRMVSQPMPPVRTVPQAQPGTSTSYGTPVPLQPVR